MAGCILRTLPRASGKPHETGTPGGCARGFPAAPIRYPIETKLDAPLTRLQPFAADKGKPVFPPAASARGKPLPACGGLRARRNS